MIYDLVLSATPLPFELSGFDLLSHYHSFLLSIRRWFDIFLQIPISSYIGFSFSNFSQLGQCALALYKLSTVEDPSLDVDFVRNTVNLSVIGEQVASNMARVPDVVGSDRSEGEGVFTITSKKIKSIMQRWDAKLQVETTNSQLRNGQEADDCIVSDAFPTDLSEEAWLTDILTSWAC
jgi:hypothetical protein